MAYYALIVSLKQTLEPLVDSVGSKIQIPNSELKLIYDDLCYLKSFFNKIISLEQSNSVEELEKQIEDVVQKAQDLIESHLSDLVHPGDESSVSGFSRELGEVKDRLGSLIEMVKAKEDWLTGNQQSARPLTADVAVSSEIDFGRNNIIVGLRAEIMQLKDRVFGMPSSLQVICIVGMAGIGKTALAKQVYLDPLTNEHFHILLFLEIGIAYELKDLLLRLLGQLVSEQMKEATVNELRFQLYRYLYGRRYLVVLDDIWDTRAWVGIGLFFPDNGNGSRIICTTRITHVARYIGRIHQKCFLDDDESWDLLCKMAFSDTEMCPSELEEIGKTIAQNLGGLPLPIVEIGKLLSISPATVESWRRVAQNIKSHIQQTAIPKILNASYAQLPQHLKACFLYFGLFQPNYNIPTSQLIRLWVAEGFVQPAPDKTLEEIAEEYLEDLVSRSLVIINERSSTGRIKTCRMHQVLQNLCVIEARQQKLIHLVNQGFTSSRDGTRNQRRLSIQSDVVFGAMESASSVRSLVFMCPQQQYPLPVFVRCRWLRVLDALTIRFCKFPDEVLRLVRLRYLAITYDGEDLPPSISRLWNLQVLIIHKSQSIKSSVLLPLEIWKLHKLRHLQCMGFDLPDPSMEEATDFLFFGKLLTLSGVSARSCIEGVLARMPNLIKLGIWLEPTTTEYAIETFCFDAIFTHLRLLESFKCTPMNRSEAVFPLKGCPPLCLRKLSLSGCGFVWGEHMPMIAQLPLLQVLKLRWHAFCGSDWEIEFGDEFCSLEVLVLEDLDIEDLRADETNFPLLRLLLIRRCYNLREIPLGLGEIPTLEVIELDDCSMSVIESAKRIQEEQQEEYENYDLQVRICSSSHVVDDDVEEVGKSTAKTKETKAAWSPDEDILLVKAWYNTSTDSIIGNQQKRKDFWEKITAYYNEWKPEGTAARSLSQVKNHYYRLNPDLNKWAGIYNNFWSNRASGQGDDDVLEAAKRAWRNDDPKNKDFKFLHVWKMIQTCEKWTPQQMPQNPQKKAKNSETDSPSSTDTGARMRPMGQQRAKRQAKQKAKMTSTANEDKWKHLQETMNKQMNLREVQLKLQEEHLKLQEEQLKLQEEHLKLQEEQLKLQHIQFCRHDTSGMSEDELYNHFKLVAEIKAKYGWK